MPRKTFRDPVKERPNLPQSSKFDVKKIEAAEEKATEVLDKVRTPSSTKKQRAGAEDALRAASRVRTRQGLPERAAANQPGKPGKMTTGEAFDSIIGGLKRASNLPRVAKENLEEVKRKSRG